MDWSRLRYDRLLPQAAKSRRGGDAYASLVATVEWRADRRRRAAAGRRIARWLGVGAARAAHVYWRCLRSEAREEADAAFFMAHPGALAAAFDEPFPLPQRPGPVIYATLHLGSPVLGYLHLRRRLGADLALVARALDPGNPMAEAKRRFALRKVAWAEATAGRAFLATDGAAMLRVRAQLRAGQPIFLLADVPGDAVGRSAPCTLFGEAVRLASGLTTLARIAASPVQTLVVTRGRERLAVRRGALVEAASSADLLAAVLDALAPFIRAHADEWWMWPYLPPAFDTATG